jgi:UDP-N-acetylglucosamine 4,6-dehydratase
MNQETGTAYLITGGTGSFGRAFASYLLKQDDVSRIVIFSRDEFKQHQMGLALGNDPRLRMFIGDVRDQGRLERAMQGIDFVVHAAALKQVDTGEYNPNEFVKTNVFGSQNVIEASLESRIKKVVALSTDKASSPINLYGATKLTADKLFSAANSYSGSYGTHFACVRYGNVMESRGSVIPLWQEAVASGTPIPLTDERMTRFWISIPQAVNFVQSCFEMMRGGELFVPKIPSMRLVDLAEAVAPGHPLKEIGLRPGEKLHEEMVSIDDARRTVELPDRFVIEPVQPDWGYLPHPGPRCEEGFAYRSDTNDEWLSLEDIRGTLNSL